MRFLFTTLQTHESEFYGRVGRELERRGNVAVHVTVSRAAARELREGGSEAVCLMDEIASLEPEPDLAAETRRIEERYGLPTIREVYRVDWAADGLSEVEAVRRTVRHFRALERIVERTAPDVIVPEVGNETIRQATHLVGVSRGIPVLFPFHTIFPRPLRLYVDTLHAPICTEDELRELTPEESAELDAFVAAFTERKEPIRRHHRVPIEWRRVELFADHVRRSRGEDRDNEYNRPWRLLRMNASEWTRARVARPFYDELDPERPFVYFPLHVVDDYKIKKVIPHCYDQASIVEQVADALPPGHDLVLKEHPMSIGRNSLELLRRLRSRPNVRLLQPYANSHDLVRRAEGVAVISSTVGLEALLYGKPVLTLGEPFYSGFGVTLDLRSFAEIRSGVPALLRFRPDPERIRRFLHAAMRQCYAGSSVTVDRSDDNARALAASFDEAARRVLAGRRQTAVPA
jgi:hypothetical protein